MDLYTPFISWAPPPLQPPGTEAGNIGHYMPHAEQRPTYQGRRVAPSMRQQLEVVVCLVSASDFARPSAPTLGRAHTPLLSA